MIDTALTIIAPHLCLGCGQIGTLLCDNCKYDIISEPYERCIVCGNLTVSGICSSHRLPYQKAWCVGERRDILRQLIGAYKFRNMKAGSKVIATLLDQTVPELPPSTIVVPIPTAWSHIRERGYDHMRLIAREFARRRSLPSVSVIARQHNTMQRHANRAERIHQAGAAFKIDKPVDPDAHYLLIDDVITSGATLEQAAKVLRNAGARSVWVAVVARQPLN